LLQPRSGFEHIDQTANPGHFVRILDQVSPVWHEIRRQSYAALGVGVGDHLLDVGCGTGDVGRAMAELVGPTGWVVGVDRSQTVLTEARRRAEGSKLPIEFRLGDVYQLDFADNTFDGCRAERLFMHLERPAEALAEMCRVARSGGRIVVADPDVEAWLVDAPDQILTRKILHFSCALLANGWIGRQLPRLFKQAGLVDIAISPQILTQTDFSRGIAGLNSFPLADNLTQAVASGVVSAQEADTWVRQLQEASEAGQFFSAVFVVMASGRKP
jgi:ubiquinone/menaquinone biosynthesis C-methylase UbiE